MPTEPSTAAIEKAAEAIYPHYFGTAYGEHAREEARHKARAALVASGLTEAEAFRESVEAVLRRQADEGFSDTAAMSLIVRALESARARMSA